MKRLLKLRSDRKAHIAKMRAMLDAAGDSHLSEEQDAEYKGLETQLATLNASIEREEKLIKVEDDHAADVGRDTAAGRTAVPVATSGEEPPRFANFGEYLRAVGRAYIHGEVDHRLYGATGMSEGSAPDGGYAVQTDFINKIIEPMYEPGSLLSRCTEIPIGPNSNGAKIPIVDETSRADGFRWGGVLGYWLAEAAQKIKSKPTLALIEFNLKKVAALGYATDELIEDAPLMESLLLRAFQSEVRFQVEAAVINGDGQGKPLGILRAAALVSQAIEGSQTIANTNLSIALNTSKMLTHLPPGSLGNAIWLANLDFLPTLVTASISGSAGTVPVWAAPGLLQNAPFGTLWGRPVLFLEYMSAVGTPGDIVLADMSLYGLATKGGPKADQSMHVKFETDEMTYRVVYRVDGQPLARTSVTPYKGATAKSPFVALATRS